MRGCHSNLSQLSPESKDRVSSSSLFDLQATSYSALCDSGTIGAPEGRSRAYLVFGWLKFLQQMGTSLWHVSGLAPESQV